MPTDSTGNIHEVLKRYWGYDTFRELQEEIITSVLDGNDTLGLLPTGGGKSITFQVPTLSHDGMTIVVTPIISLMKDQVDNLVAKGIKATYVHSGLSLGEIRRTLDKCTFGNYKFLYISPERIASQSFIDKMRFMPVKLIVVDEAHCISQWGYDFRPSFLNIAQIREYFPSIPMLALTATATPDVVADIMDKLKFSHGKVFSKSFARKNLVYVVRQTDDKVAQLVSILQKVPGSGIVYVRNRARTKQIAEELNRHGIVADFYHAGLENTDKSDRQNKWKSGQTRVMVATNAFGMGIDKPDVRLVAHIDIPGSLEEYYQEAGRAGRDGKKAFVVMLTKNTDKAILKKRISDLLVVVMPEFHQWTGAVVFRPEDFDIGEGGNLPPEDVTASLGAKKICDPALLRGFSQLKSRAERLLDENGISYCNGFAIPVDKSRDVLNQLDQIVDEYEDLRESFLHSYDLYVEDWASQHPEFADQIRRGKKSRQEVGRSISADYKVVQVYPFNKDDEAYEAEAAELTDTLYEATVKAADQLYKESFQGREEVTARCFGALKRIREKLDGLSFLDSSLRPFVQMIDSTFQALPPSGPYKVEPFKLTKKNFYEPLTNTKQMANANLFDHLDDDLQYLFDDHPVDEPSKGQLNPTPDESKPSVAPSEERKPIPVTKDKIIHAPKCSATPISAPARCGIVAPVTSTVIEKPQVVMDRNVAQRAKLAERMKQSFF